MHADGDLWRCFALPEAQWSAQSVGEKPCCRRPSCREALCSFPPLAECNPGALDSRGQTAVAFDNHRHEHRRIVLR